MGRPAKRHKLPRDVDFAQLRDQLSVRLGRPVEVLATPPADGVDGELIVCCRHSDEQLAVDPTAVQAAIGLTPDPPSAQSNEQRLLADMSAAVGVDAQLAAIRAFLKRAVDSELRLREDSARAPLPGVDEGVFVDLSGRPGSGKDPRQPANLHPRHELAAWNSPERRTRERPG